MSRNAGFVSTKQASKNLRRFQLRSTPIVMNNSAPSNLVTPIGFSPSGARLIVDSLVIYNYTTINDIAMGTLKVGTAAANGTLTDDTILSLDTAAFNAIKRNTPLHHRTTYQSGSLSAALKATVGHPYELGYPIVPANFSIVATVTAMATSGTGSIVIAVFGWEADDEND